MEIKFGSVALSAGVFSFIGLPVQADHHMEMQFAPTELMTCAYKDGKDNDDLRKLTNAFTKWVKKNHTEYTYYLLSPNWREDASEWDFAWVGSWTSGAGMAVLLAAGIGL